MSETRSVALIQPQARQAGASLAPGLADALRAKGAVVREYRLPQDLEAMLDAIQGDALPVVLKE